MQITAVILAGGRGMRMGGVDKGLINYQGKPMIEHVLSRITPQVDQVIINANRNLDHYQNYGVPIITDDNDRFDGPLAGMQAGMRHALTDWIVTLPCDSPLLPLDLVKHLCHAIQTVQAISQPSKMLVIARSPSGIHPVFCLMPCSLHDDLSHFLASGQRRVSAWQVRHHHAYVDFNDEQAFTNINQPIT